MHPFLFLLGDMFVFISLYKIKEHAKNNPDKIWIGYKTSYYQVVQLDDGSETLAVIDVILVDMRDAGEGNDAFFVDYGIESQEVNLYILCKDVKVTSITVITEGDEEDISGVTALAEYDKVDRIIELVSNKSKPKLYVVK